MPAQKRLLETSTLPPPAPPLDKEKADDSPKGSDNHNQQTENTSDSDVSPHSSDGEKEEFIIVKLAEIRKEVQCPICLGIIKKTRTVMECLHRFCRECIDKSMRLGNNECPACRTHCASRRSLRDDPNYDALIAALYPDIDKYEEEELALYEEEKAHNKQIQASFAQTFQRQTEALGKKRASARLTAAAFAKEQSNYRNSRGHKSLRLYEQQVSDEEAGANKNDGSKDSSSAGERVEVKSKRHKRLGARSSHDNHSEPNRDSLGATAGLIGCREMLAWGKARMRSNNRHNALNGTGGKIPVNDRIPKLIDHLRSSNENDAVLKISLTLVSLDEENIASLIRPYLHCSSTLSIRHLCQYVAMQTSLEASEIEILMVKDCHPVNNSSSFRDKPGFLNPHQKELQLLNEEQTLGEIHASFIQQNLVLAYRRKVQDEGN